MKRLMIAAALCCSLAAAAQAAERVRTKLYFCRRAEAPPVLDGALDEACWRDAYSFEDFGFLRFGGKNDPIPRTTVRVVYDDAFMYIAFDCGEPFMDKARLNVMQSKDLWWRECLEIYIDTEHDRKGYTCLWANPVGETFSERRINMGWAMVKDDSFRLWARWEYTPRMYDDRWVVEARISMHDLGISPTEGTVVGFNPCRFRHTVQPSQYMCWATVGGRQKDASQFGHMVLGDRPANVAEVLKRIYPGYRDMIIEIPKGDKLDVYEHGQVTTLSFRDVVEQRIRQTETAVAEMTKAPATDKKAATALAEAETELARIKDEFAALATVTEGSSLNLSSRLHKIEAGLADARWRLRAAEIVENLRQRIAAAQETP